MESFVAQSCPYLMFSRHLALGVLMSTFMFENVVAFNPQFMRCVRKWKGRFPGLLVSICLTFYQ